ncbi:hypothetical protein A9945_07625 [Acinetobacter baumannii]|nr:ATP-binding protein [Acinetobacter baumannii]OBO65940.1 hypothetical protein A9945_07625 [Acinetobacter baumannii]
MFDHSFSFDCQDKVILVVEDDYDIGDIIENYLKREGMSVIRAMNGKQAIELHASQPIDLILLDIKLPELNGWEVLNKIRQKAQTPVIMLTALDQDIDKVMALLVPELDLTSTPVYCDRRRIEQVLIALIDNAIRYSHAGKLKISSEVVSQNWILKIEDEGPGIATEFQDDLFKPFFRLEESRNKEFGGTGLGLAVVHAIIVALKGTIQYSNQGSKSIFTIKISMNN